MIKNHENRMEAEGILSFIKGCDRLVFGPTFSNLNWRLTQESENPVVYTKIYCFLTWIASQYGLQYTFPEYDKV